MDLRYSPEDEAFRLEVRTFIDANLPEDIRNRSRHGHGFRKEDIVSWQRTLNRKGWAAYSWPKEYGGPGWSPTQRMIFQEETMMGNALIMMLSSHWRETLAPALVAAPQP